MISFISVSLTFIYFFLCMNGHLQGIIFHGQQFNSDEIEYKKLSNLLSHSMHILVITYWLQ